MGAALDDAWHNIEEFVEERGLSRILSETFPLGGDREFIPAKQSFLDADPAALAEKLRLFETRLVALGAVKGTPQARLRLTELLDALRSAVEGSIFIFGRDPLRR